MTPEYFLGWDCAYRTLAWIYVKVEHQAIFNVQKFINDAGCGGECGAEDVLAAKEELGRAITVISCGVTDVLGESIDSLNDCEKIRRLKSWLTSSPVAQIYPSTRVFIEDQPVKIGRTKVKRDSSFVSAVLAYYYADFATAFVDPKLKQHIILSPEINYGKMMDECKAKYKNKADGKKRARKLLAEANFKYFCNVVRSGAVRQVKAAQLNHLADALMTILSGASVSGNS